MDLYIHFILHFYNHSVTELSGNDSLYKNVKIKLCFLTLGLYYCKIAKPGISDFLEGYLNLVGNAGIHLTSIEITICLGVIVPASQVYCETANKVAAGMCTVLQ